jgi:hypothetical protein
MVQPLAEVAAAADMGGSGRDVNVEFSVTHLIHILIRLSCPHSQLGLVRLFPIHMYWRGLIRIGGDFDLLEIETPSIPLNPYGLG